MLALRSPIYLAGCGLAALGFFANYLITTLPPWFMGPQAALLVMSVGTLVCSARVSARTIGKTYLLLASAVLMILIGEVALRAVLVPVKLGNEWAGSHGSEMLLVSAPDNFNALHRYNSHGFRGPELSPQGTSNRIVCIGDSYTEGIGATEQQTWPAVLNREVPPGWEAVNFGDAGSAPDRYLEILAQAAVPLDPQVVIICLNSSDLIGGPKIPTRLGGNTFFDGGGVLRSQLARALTGWTYLYDLSRGRHARRIGLYYRKWDERRTETMVRSVMRREAMAKGDAERLVAQRMDRISAACRQASERGEFNGARIVIEVVKPFAHVRCRAADMEVSADVLRNKTRAWCQSFRDICESRGIRPVLMYFPNAGLVSNEPIGPVEDDQLQGRPENAGETSLSDLLSEVCQQVGIHYIDATPVLLANADRRLYLRYDSHPNSLGYELVGRYVAEQLTRGAELSRNTAP